MFILGYAVDGVSTTVIVWHSWVGQYYVPTDIEKYGWFSLGDNKNF